MALTAEILEHPALLRLRVPEGAPAARPVWSRAELAGRLCELIPGAQSAVLSAAVALVFETQEGGVPVAWVTARESCFYPPDVAAAGVDLAALPVVRVSGSAAVGRTADLLLRSGAFGLVVLDLGCQARVADALQSRLVQLALKHDAVVLCLTETSSLGSLVSLRAEASRRRVGEGRYACEIHVIKDKRRGPGWRWREVWRGPEGLW
jgi:recombination protein RecA